MFNHGKTSFNDVSVSLFTMNRRMRLFLSTAILALITTTTALSQSPYRPFASRNDSLEAMEVVKRYYAVADSAYLDSTTITSLATGDLVSRMIAALGRPIRPSNTLPWHVERACALRRSTGDALAIVVVPTVIGTAPRFGTVTVDLIYYLKRTANGWRILDHNRQLLVENVIDQLREIDSSSAYPPSLKPIIAREISALLLSNEQARRHFADNRPSFDSLIRRIQGERNLHRLARIDRRPEQINNVAIVWSNSAQEIPRQAITEYEKTLKNQDELKDFRQALANLERLRKIGEDSVTSVTKRLRINRASMDFILQRMRDLRLVFLNIDLPWKNAIQLTVGGSAGHSIGYIYSPQGELPDVSTEEYFYLEDLGGGWWLFRAK